MTEKSLVKLYEQIRTTYGTNFKPDFGGYTMVRETAGLYICIEPPQQKLVQGEKTSILVTAPLIHHHKTPEELQDILSVLISKRDALERKTYRGELRDYDDGIEYVYEVPTRDESKLTRIVRDFNNI